MKKIAPLFALALLLLFTSCDTGSDDQRYTFELLKIESVDIPTEFTLGQTYPITVHYNLPTSCHFFNQIYYDKYLNIRTIAVESAVLTSSNCEETPTNASTFTFNFYVTSNGSYTFKFYQGKDVNGQDTYLEYEVPVTN